MAPASTTIELDDCRITIPPAPPPPPPPKFEQPIDSPPLPAPPCASTRAEPSRWIGPSAWIRTAPPPPPPPPPRASPTESPNLPLGPKSSPLQTASLVVTLSWSHQIPQ